MWFSILVRGILVAISPLVAAYGLYIGNEHKKIIAVLAGAAVASAATVALDILSIIRPAKKLTTVRGFVLAQYAAGITEPLAKHGIDVRLNLMVPFRPARWGFRRHFQVIWSQRMEGFPDADIWIPIRHGAVGKAYASGYAVAADREALEGGDLPFPRRLRRTVRHLTCVVSHPVYGGDYEPGRPRGKRIAVLSIDSTTADALAHLKGAECFEGMKKLAAIAGRLIF